MFFCVYEIFGVFFLEFKYRINIAGHIYLQHSHAESIVPQYKYSQRTFAFVLLIYVLKYLPPQSNLMCPLSHILLTYCIWTCCPRTLLRSLAKVLAVQRT